MGYFISGNGDYYVGDRQGADAVVTKRPDAEHDWNGVTWVVNAGRMASRLAREGKTEMELLVEKILSDSRAQAALRSGLNR